MAKKQIYAKTTVSQGLKDKIKDKAQGLSINESDYLRSLIIEDLKK